MAKAKKSRNRRGKILGILLLAVALSLVWKYRPIHLDLDMTGPVAEWRDYGNDRGGTRYSPLSQITPDNVRHLEKVWEYHTGDMASDDIPSNVAFEGTPTLINGTLYIPTPFNRIVALDPETGKERWSYNPDIDLTGNYSNQLICRGITYWENESAANPRRLFMGTNDARLIAIDADSGKACEGFGAKGEIDLNVGPGEQRWKGEYQVTSPPAVSGDTVIVGSAVGDNSRVDAPSGVVRGYDAVTGTLKWAWDLRPPNHTPPPEMLSDGGYMLGTPNVWAPMAVDEERDLVFVPTGNAAPDYYGGMRNGADHYGSSVVALRASTGEVVWNFQTVHHDLWDFDVPAQPLLTDVVRDGETIPVVIQGTKMGLVFVLHRETGEPIFEVEERPVPQTDVPGEITSPTQPFPTKPPQLVPNELAPEDAWGLIWSDAGECREILEGLRFDGMYTPPAVGVPTLMYPGNAGGTNWGGLAVDPDRQLLIANVMDVPWAVTLIPADELDEWRARYPGAEIGSQSGTPYGLLREMVVSSLVLPCNPPPWGTLAAIDLATGDIAWQHAFGTVRDVAPVPIPLKLGVPNLGGPIVTASGLIFIGAAMDNYLRAFDVETGKELWKGRLPAGGQATPLTYRIRPDGKQYVVIAAGGHGRAGTTLGDSVVAYALPD